MSCKGRRFHHELKTPYPQEYEAVNFAYTQAGWIEVGVIPHENGLPHYIVYEWPKDRPPVYPHPSWP